MALEIERKYLLKSSHLIDFLQDEGIRFIKQEIVQFYTLITQNEEIRLRKCNEIYTCTRKHGAGMVRHEDEKEVDKSFFQLSKESAIGNIIKKTRYSFKFLNQVACIDVYKEHLKGIVVLEIEFQNEDLAQKLSFPKAIYQHIQRELTQDTLFKNKHLALYGRSDFYKSSLDQIYKNIEKNPLQYDVAQFLPPALNAYNANRTIFYSLSKKIAFHKNSYLEHKTNEDLHQIRVNIRKTRSLLQCVDNVFDPSIQDRFIVDFKKVANASNSKRDRDVFMEFLQSLDELEAKFVLYYMKKSDENSSDIKELLSGDFYEALMQDWAIVLQDKDGFFSGSKAKCPHKQIGAIAIYNRLKKMKKKLKRLDEWVELEEFHKVRIEFKKLRYLSEYFSPLFENTNLHVILKSSKNMQNIFGVLQDRDSALKILKHLESDTKLASNVEFIYSSEVIQEIIKNDIYDLKLKILQKKKKFFKLLKLCTKELKNYIGE